MILKINKKITKPKKGFMMTEVLITALLIVITMVGVLPILFSGVKSSKTSKTRAVMMNIAQKEIEAFNQDKFNNIFNKIKNDMTVTNMPIFLNGSIDYPFPALPPEELCINITTGNITPVTSTCPKKILIKKVYSFLKGDDSMTDDVIKLSVTVQINGETSKPVSLTSVLGRDKI